ncbi:hypothetical protein FB451DRAFT_1162208 [Mycena latifolia]|nr:hypothetical protein FB451DRAFT_1162208 [Mycena latifolia]
MHRTEMESLRWREDGRWRLGALVLPRKYSQIGREATRQGGGCGTGKGVEVQDVRTETEKRENKDKRAEKRAALIPPTHRAGLPLPAGSPHCPPNPPPPSPPSHSPRSPLAPLTKAVRTQILEGTRASLRFPPSAPPHSRLESEHAPRGGLVGEGRALVRRSRGSEDLVRGTRPQIRLSHSTVPQQEYASGREHHLAITIPHRARDRKNAVADMGGGMHEEGADAVQESRAARGRAGRRRVEGQWSALYR